MPETPEWADWRQLLETGRHFTAVTRADAQQRAQELVREGKLAQDKVQQFADALVRTSRRRADELVTIVRAEVRRQLEAVGLKDRPASTADAAKKQTAKRQSAKKKAAKKQASKKKNAEKQATKKKTGKKQATKKKTGKKKTGKKKTGKQTAKKQAATTQQAGAERRPGPT